MEGRISLFLDSRQWGLYLYIVCPEPSYQAYEAADVIARPPEDHG